MSPASQSGGLHVERYLGSYLISSSGRGHKFAPDYDGARRKLPPKPQYAGPPVFRGGFAPDGLFQPPAYCPGRASWAGAPLISTAGRRTRRPLPGPGPPGPHSPPFHRQPVQVVSACPLDYAEGQHLPLSRLALHTQGAPLILSRRYNNNRKQNQYQNNNNNNNNPRPFVPANAVRAPANPDIVKKIRENMPKENRFDNKERPLVQRTVPQNGHNAVNMDSLSVTSDESSGSAHSETCLPRIIKPRKRRKKDRKPLNGSGTDKDPTLAGSHLDSADYAPEACLSNIQSFMPNCYDRVDLLNPSASVYIASGATVDKAYRVNSASKPQGATSGTVDSVTETDAPKLQHSFEDVDEDESDDSSSLFEAISRCSPTVCQCRYCDPSGQIWDIDQHCYSPFLTAPADYDFGSPSMACDKNPFTEKDTLLRRSWSEPCSGYSIENLHISDYEKRSSPHRSDPNISSGCGAQEHCAAPGSPRSAVGVIGAGRRAVESLDSPSTLDWREKVAPQSQLVPETLFKSSSSHGVSLEVSSAIVTSLNGHRDLEIKFFSTSPSAVAPEQATFLYPNRSDSVNKPFEGGISTNSFKCDSSEFKSVTVQ